MNDELKELEFELSCLRPRVPSEFLAGRVEAALNEPPSGRWMWLRGCAGAGFAAAIAALVAFGPALMKPASTTLQPVAAEERLESARHEGLMTLDDGSQASRWRLRYLETVSWSGEGRTLTWTAPREEVRIVPVVIY